MDWNDLLKQVAAGESFTVNEGTLVSGAMLSELLQAARASDNRPTLHKANFKGVVFSERADFTNALFKGEVSFQNASFEQGCRFSLAQFGYANFRQATFQGYTIFESLGNSHRLDFSSASFNGYSSFGPLNADQVDFNLTIFTEWARFADFRIKSFLNFVGARFEESVSEFNVGCGLLALNRARFERGATLRVHGGRIELRDSEFLAPSFILGSRTSGPWSY